METQYQLCNYCVMDTSDPDIYFSQDGRCNHCENIDAVIKEYWLPNEKGAAILSEKVASIKQERIHEEYDCIMGLSGGIDSSYLAYVVKTLELRPLVVHIDTGWNSEIAVQNIEAIVKELDFDLYTLVVDWDEMRDLQLAFFKSGVPNQDVPQDHAIFAGLYNFAVEHNIRHVINGANHATECILPAAWGHAAEDYRQLKSIHRAFGKKPLGSFPLTTFYRNFVFFPYIKKMERIQPLNLMPYNKAMAVETLQQELGWKNYGGKHHESRFTRFFQGYFLPTRFGYDKRRAHLSSMIVTGQIDRDTALRELEQPPYSPEAMEDDLEYVLKKLGIDKSIWDNEIMNIPLKTYKDYPNQDFQKKLLYGVRDFSRPLRKLFK